MASWKKVIVSGSVAELSAVSASAGINIGGLDHSAVAHVLSTDATGSVISIAQSALEGASQVLQLSGSTGTQTLTLNQDHLEFDSGNGVTTALSTEAHGGSPGNRKIFTINTAQDIRKSASPVFNDLTISGSLKHAVDGGTENTSIDFTDNVITFNAGGKQIVSFDGSPGGSDNIITVGKDDSDTNFRIRSAQGGGDDLFFADASASLSSSAGVEAGKGKIIIGMSSSANTATLVESEEGAYARLIVSGSTYVLGSVTASGAITASAFVGDGSSLTNVTATTLTSGDSSIDPVSIAAFTSSITSSVFNNSASIASISDLTGSMVSLEGEKTAARANSLLVFSGSTGVVYTGSNTLQVTVNENHFTNGGGNSAINDGSGSFYLYAQTASIGEDLNVGGDLSVTGVVSTFTGFSFNEGQVTITSGSTRFGSGSAPADVDADGGHQFTGSLFITGGINIDTLTEADSSTVVVFKNNRLHTTASTALNVGGGTIGAAGDGDYTDGFFTAFTDSTTIGDAIDQISEAFSLLAPPNEGVLGALSFETPGLQSAILASGLTSVDWYANGITAGDTVNIIDNNGGSSPTIDIQHQTVLAGKYPDFAAAAGLSGGVTASIKHGSDGFFEITRDYGSESVPGTGETSATRPDFSAKVKTANLKQQDGSGAQDAAEIWAQVDLSIEDFAPSTAGQFQLKLKGDNDGGTSPTSTIYWAGLNGGDFPNQTGTINSVPSSSVSFNTISGIKYYRAGNFTPNITVTEAFSPVYQNSNVTVLSTGNTNTVTTGALATDSSPHAYNEDMTSVQTDALTLNANNDSGYATLPKVRLNVLKPSKSTVSAQATMPYAINTYTTDQDFDGTTSTAKFLSEGKRVIDLDADTWNGITSLATFTSADEGQLAVQNGRLVSGKGASATGFADGSTTDQPDYTSYLPGHSGGSFANYFRLFTNNGTTMKNRFNGTLSFDRGTSDWTSANNPISPWNDSATGTQLQMALILDVGAVSGNAPTGTFTAGRIYDFGRAQGNNSGNIYGIRGSGTSGNSATTSIPFGLPIINGTLQTTRGDDFILWIRYHDSSDNFISDLSLALEQ